MPYSTDPQLSRLIARHFPAVKITAGFCPLDGLTGLSRKIELGEATLLARYQQPQAPIPGVDRRREYHILRKLSVTDLAPEAIGYADNWLLLRWQAGECFSEAAFLQELLSVTARVAQLHRQKLSGYRLRLLRLLEQYWQISRPERRRCRWLRALRRLQQQGEPQPLRLSLLHMDIHPGNIIRGQDGLTLIDWEYASDGDVALELAAIVLGNHLNDTQQQQMIEYYATLQKLDAMLLKRQMLRWRPWLKLLIANWYELRWQRGGEVLFYTLAEQAWQRVLSE
ncbi:thiamine kinase [Erwinia endophytica]|nr:thiamine kinase [Erwinia endophytica]